MDDPTSKFADELKYDLHGEQVGSPHGLVCDYCGAEIDITEPVMYDALRVVDMPNLETLIGPPEEWILDAARCRNCEIESIEPATDGFDEALIVLSINESNSVLSADASEMTIVDSSPDGDGYYPPRVAANVLVTFDDPGYARWARMSVMLEDLQSGDFPAESVESIQESIRQSKEVPPSINV